jgi:hypothetical protein
VKIIQALYFFFGLLALYVASALSSYKLGVPVGILWIVGSVALGLIARRQQ